MSESIAFQRTTYPLAAYNFRVTIGDIAMGFSEVSGLALEYQTITCKHGLSYWEGESITKFRYDKYVPITLKKGAIAGFTQIYEWLELVEKKSLSISLCDETGAAVVTWQIKKAIVTKLEAPTFEARSDEAAIETLTLMVSGISIETQ